MAQFQIKGSMSDPCMCLIWRTRSRGGGQVVGVGSVFFWPAPVLLKQGYLVVTGVTIRLHVHLCSRVDHLDAAHRHGALRPLRRARARGPFEGEHSPNLPCNA